MRLLVLNSGGFDSTVVMELMTILGHECTSFFIDFGQRTADKERESVKNNIALHKWECMSIEHTITMPIHISENYYVPSRNVIFLAHAISYAEKYKYDGIVVGFHKGDDYHSDNSPEFLELINGIANNVGLEVLSPLMSLDKYGVFKLGQRLGIKIDQVWSCDYGVDGEYCGECRDCLFIKEAVRKGILDKNVVKMG